MITPIEYFKKGWDLIHDPDDIGLENKWYEGIPADGAVKAEVPSFVHMYLTDCYGVAWYQYRFTTKLKADEDNLLILRFGMADFITNVYINGRFVGKHVGCEDEFSFDATEFVESDKENLLVVRVSKPYTEDVDGYTFNEIPHRNQHPEDYFPGWCYNEFGLGGAVSLAKIPKVCIADSFIYGNVESSCVEIEYTIKNCYDRKITACITTECGNKRTGEFEACDVYNVVLDRGDNIIKRTVQLEDVLLWDIDDPNLYYVNMSVKTDNTEHIKRSHCGFRTFEVGEDGYFRLNGRRIFLRSSHTGNSMPETGHHFCRDKSFIRKDMYFTKAMGLNTVRFISGAALPEQLDYCDEIGLMVYEEPTSSWLLQSSYSTKEYYQHNLFTMMRRDRSHPCLTIWGFLNETHDYEPRRSACRIARDSLKAARKIDPTRLVLYSSGRWDGDVKYGSVSNPFTTEWQTLWNEEGADIKTGLQKTEQISGYPGGFVPHVGDIHAYPKVPIAASIEKMLRTLGCKTDRPVFYSEMGFGSMFDVIWLRNKFEEWGSNPNFPDVRVILGIAELFEADIKRYGFEGEFAFSIDILRESQRRHNRYRMSQFNIIRSNPLACGYSITGLLDHGITGEGLFTYMREWKPGITDTLQAAFAPLKWCLFLDSMHVYSGREFEIEGVLANEDVLKLRDYDIEVKIFGKQGVVYSEAMTLHVTENDLKYMAIPVFKKKIVLNVPEGEYELRAEILQGAAAFDGRLTFYISEDANAKTSAKAAVVYGLSNSAVKLLEDKGVELKCLCEADESEKSVIILGDIADDKKDEIWTKINRMLENGSRVFAASRYAFVKDKDYEYYLPMKNKPENLMHTRESSEWVYHKEYLAKRDSAYFKNLPTGMMNWDYYMHVISGHRFYCKPGEEPDAVEAANFGTGIAVKCGYEGGVTIGTYNIGAGAITVCALNIIDNVGKNPAADRLLLNALSAESEKL